MKKNMFVFNTNKCVGCMACVVGCSIENNTTISLNWREVATLNTYNHPEIPILHLSMACNHCEDAPCMKHCPAMAYKRDYETGAILHIAEACIGCTYCTWACPYDAPKYNTETKIIEKCNFCIDKLKIGLKTACADACPVGALEFSFNENENYEKAKTIIDTAIKPSIKIIPLNPSLEKPEIITTEKAIFNAPFIDKKTSKIKLKKEWTLVLFTLVVACLVALFSANVTHNIIISSSLYLGISLVAIVLSSFHVGKKLRMWRFILNIKSSWLSKEILGFSLFLIFSYTSLVILNNLQKFDISNTVLSLLNYFTIGLGAFTLFAVDMVYKFLIREDKLPLHSASIVLTTIFLYAWFTSTILLILIITFIKIALYFLRKIAIKNYNLKTNMIGFLRIAFLTIPLILILVYPQISLFVLIPLIFIGEVIDRSEFYVESDISTPKKQLISKFSTN